MLQHRVAFPLVRYTGRYTIRFESEISTGGGGLPKRPHVHVYEGKVRNDHKVFIAAFWIEPDVEEKARGRNVTDVEVQDAAAELRNVTAPDPTSPWLHWPDLDADIFLDDDE
jgi:hypothetical protein